jgi:hypothetical protein
MTTPLSPAAQAVRDAYKTGGLDAALRAAADQVVPPSLEAEFCNRNPSLTLQKAVEIRSGLLALATELDPTP